MEDDSDSDEETISPPVTKYYEKLPMDLQYIFKFRTLQEKPEPEPEPATVAPPPRIIEDDDLVSLKVKSRLFFKFSRFIDLTIISRYLALSDARRLLGPRHSSFVWPGSPDFEQTVLKSLKVARHRQKNCRRKPRKLNLQP